RSSLSNQQVVIVENAVSKFRELVSDKLGQTNILKHYIDTDDASLVKQRQYLLSPAVQKHLHREVDDMLSLGIIRRAGLHADPDKVSAILNFPTPRAIIPLIKGKRKGESIKWTSEADRAFQEIKRRISSAPGAVLFQKVGDAKHPVGYASLTLTSVEMKYCATEQELLPVVFGIEHFRGYVEELTGRYLVGVFVYRILISKFNIGQVNSMSLSRSISSLNIELFQPDECYLYMNEQVKDDPDKFPSFKVEGQYLYKFVLSALPMRDNIPDWKLVVPPPSPFQYSQIVVFDNGSQFVSKEFRSFLYSVKVPKVWLNARYHPQTNPTERVGVTKSVFGRHVPIYGDFYNPVDLDKPLEVDNKLLWSQEMAQLPDLYQEVKDRLHRAYEQNVRQYNLRKRPLSFSVGDMVWKKNFVQSGLSTEGSR
ncbi:hypothetical protein ILUMI_15801, partial [Ignelater luminosus]